MIAIVNIGPHDAKNPLGERTYEVRINSQVITTFRHKRADGLSRCLFEVSKAVAMKQWNAIGDLLIAGITGAPVSATAAESPPVAIPLPAGAPAPNPAPPALDQEPEPQF